jgi:4'-phosphopantetheinyl transferase
VSARTSIERHASGGDDRGPGVAASHGLSLWLVDLDQPADVVALAAELLSDPERQRAARGSVDVRRRRVLARAALRLALADRVGGPPSALRLARDPSGKPRLDRGGPEFSVSTSADWGLIAITSLGAVGVDIERIAAIPELERIAARRFDPAAAREVLCAHGEARLRAFYRHWTRLEAALKASGIGIGRAFDTPGEGPDLGGWTIAEVDPGRGLTGAVAVAGAHPWADSTLYPAGLDVARRLRP